MSNGNAKLAAAVVGGYVLGRTKKGRAAIRFAMWVSGNQGMISQQVNTLIKSDQANALLGQIQGPVLEAIQKAALNAATARMNQLSSGLASRTEVLESADDITAGIGDKVSKGAKGAGKSVGDAAGKVTSKLHSRKGKDEAEEEPQEEPETDESDEDTEPEPEAKTPRKPAKKAAAKKAAPEPEEEPDEEPEEAPDEPEPAEDEGADDEGEDEAEADEPDEDPEAEDPPAKKAPAKKTAQRKIETADLPDDDEEE